MFVMVLRSDLSNSLTLKVCLGMNKIHGIIIKHCGKTSVRVPSQEKPRWTSPWP